MKRMLITLAALGTALVAFAQPQLREDNIEQVLQAMTLQEKATLLVGGARAAMVNGVTFNEAASAWEAAAGKYNVQFGASVDDIRCAAPFTLKKAQSWPVHNVLAPAK